MDFNETTVTDKDGNVVPAKVIVCPVCSGDQFHLFVIGQGHNHLQCSNPVCRETFCQGGCDQVTKWQMPIWLPWVALAILIIVPFLLICLHR